MLSLCIGSEIFTEFNFLDRLYIHLSSANKGNKNIRTSQMEVIKLTNYAKSLRAEVKHSLK